MVSQSQILSGVARLPLAAPLGSLHVKRLGIGIAVLAPMFSNWTENALNLPDAGASTVLYPTMF